jgi:hypothetical protein
MLNFFSQKETTTKDQFVVDLSIHRTIHEKLDYFYQSNKIPHIIFHGSSGSGKRTIMNQFLQKIYNGDKVKMKSNIMVVNCAHGKGIKFIREELKFFSKTNIQSNNGVLFKTIVLLNADFLTIDAQSALRRCIELFSHNTRFFIIVENKQKLLNPILSRFCEIYVPEHMIDGKIVNLHRQSTYRQTDDTEKQTWIQEQLACINETTTHIYLTDLTSQWYERGYSCLDLLSWIDTEDRFTEKERSSFYMCFDKIKSEFRCEKLLLLYMLDFLFLRLDKGLKSIYVL